MRRDFIFRSISIENMNKDEMKIICLASSECETESKMSLFTLEDYNFQ